MSLSPHCNRDYIANTVHLSQHRMSLRTSQIISLNILSKSATSPSSHNPRNKTANPHYFQNQRLTLSHFSHILITSHLSQYHVLFCHFAADILVLVLSVVVLEILVGARGAHSNPMSVSNISSLSLTEVTSRQPPSEAYMCSLAARRLQVAPHLHLVIMTME